jgi:TonB family protein
VPHVLVSLVLALPLALVAAGAGQQPPRDPAAARLLPQTRPDHAPETAEQADADIAALEKIAATNPTDPRGYLAIARRCEEFVRRQHAAPESERWRFVLLGGQAADRALAVDANFVDALIYKGILLRHQAVLEPDAAQKQALVAQADALRAKALVLRQGSAQLQAPRPLSVAASTQCPARGLVDGVAPLRVGGQVRVPIKTKDVRPVYPPEAQQNRIQGIIIIEVVVNANGEVVDPCVLRTVPELEAAALEAVRQWQFQPAVYDGKPWPVVMTVTVNFTLQSDR